MGSRMLGLVVCLMVFGVTVTAGSFFGGSGGQSGSGSGIGGPFGPGANIITPGTFGGDSSGDRAKLMGLLRANRTAQREYNTRRSQLRSSARRSFIPCICQQSTCMAERVVIDKNPFPPPPGFTCYVLAPSNGIPSAQCSGASNGVSCSEAFYRFPFFACRGPGRCRPANFVPIPYIVGCLNPFPPAAIIDVVVTPFPLSCCCNAEI